MIDLPKNLKYASTHEWAKLEDDNIVRVGITDFAQQELGDLVYIKLPVVGDSFQAQQHCAVVESVKTASDLYSPVTGKVVEVNEILMDEAYQVNDEPYKAWLFCIKTQSPSELDKLMDADAYQTLINK
ncbi:glycine cleavage system protein GcvH [Crenothrix sp.]|uniref:glycine cleavage system protein GcvH n=1 Tax=Crenothrix sp. TaxID=3100433 RepID=UPI00374CDABB